MTTNLALTGGPYVPPRWTIDLSLPPRDRYRELARHYRDQVQDLTGLFDALLRDVAIPEKWIPSINRLSRLLLRRIHNKSQTEELVGISEESGIPMYLLVAFNVILDLLMGCTSGGVRSLERGRPLAEAKMLHFRTLDWSMEPLRRIVVQLDFVRSSSADPDKVLASSITYVGFTGVLTGVRAGLSMSLNFRGLHDNSTKASQFRFYFHHLLVLLGRRPSIATYLRGYLTGDYEAVAVTRNTTRRTKKNTIEAVLLISPMSLANIHQDIQRHHTTAAYLIFSDGNSTISIDKDFRTAKMRCSQDFIATTNHDIVMHHEDQKENVVAARAAQSAARHAAGFNEFLDESEDRLKCLADRWKRLVSRRHKDKAKKGQESTKEETASETALTRKQVIEWVSKYPTTNECTHFGAVMDPTVGDIIWCLAYPKALREDFQPQLES